MILKKLGISNFKMFQNLELSFEPGFNLLLGDNGVGKTTILEAASVALSGFFVGMEDVATRNIYKSDIRYQIVKDKNGIPNKSYDIPVEISSTLEYDGKEYTWFRARKDASGSSRTTLNPREIRMVSQKLANDPTGREMWPVLSYQSASRHWISARSDANQKLRKQLHDRRCGYLGCMDRAVNLKSIYEWCSQMEWIAFKGNPLPENYRVFGEMISKFLSMMNCGTMCEVVYHPSFGKLMYLEGNNAMEIEDLSAGYQSVMNLVIDLAYRMAILNPDAGDEICKAQGIVLIDEIDSNLHPKWQWKIVETLTATFPNVQFLAATHSPIIVSSCKNANIISIAKEQSIQYITDSYAFSVNEILKTMLGHQIRPEKVDHLISQFESAMDHDEFSRAKAYLTQLEEILGEEHPDVTALNSEYCIEALEE